MGLRLAIVALLLVGSLLGSLDFVHSSILPLTTPSEITISVLNQRMIEMALQGKEVQLMVQEESEPLIITYIVQRGDNLTTIAKRHNIDVDTILGANTFSNPNNLTIGQELFIPSIKGVLHEVQEKETIYSISEDYSISALVIAGINSVEPSQPLKDGQLLVIPGAKPEFTLAYYLARQFIWPVSGRITSRFGPRAGGFHTGIDIGASIGTSVLAARAGRVVFSGWSGGYGNLVIIDHGDGYQTYYAHNSRNLVRVGQRVLRGQTIARVGSTGNSTGPHVHFELRRYGTPINPAGSLAGSP